MTAEAGQKIERGEPVASELRGSNQSGMRAYNERLVLSLVRRNGSLSKTDIAKMTGLSAQTVSVIMRALEAENLLVREAPIRGRVGQPSVPLSINPDGAFFFGLKVGRRSADLVLVDFLGKTIGELHLRYNWPEPSGIIAFAKDGYSTLCQSLTPQQRATIAGFGIATPFELWNWKEEVGADPGEMDSWRHVDLRAEIAAFCDVPAYLQNDATAACAAELVFGNHSGTQDFIYFYIGTFVGGGIALNGSLYSGRSGNAGALGPLPVPGIQKTSERLIDQASIMVLERMLIANGIDASPLWAAPSKWPDFGELTEKWIQIVAHGLAHAIIASASVIDFERAYIDGGIPVEIRDRIVDATRTAVFKLDLQGVPLPDITPGSVGAMARALGAASLPLTEKYLVDANAIMRARA